MPTPDLTALHNALADDIRNKRWTSNCAGEVFALMPRNNDEPSVRIGHFQGDAAIAAFVVAAHNQMVQRKRKRKRMPSVPETSKALAPV